MTANTDEITQNIDWFADLETLTDRYVRAGLDPDSAKVAAVDRIRFAKETAGQHIRFVAQESVPMFDVDGLPIGMTEATFQPTAFPIDGTGNIEPTWIEGDPR